MNRSDQDPLHEAIELSRMSIELGGGPFGAVVVHDGVVVGRGHNRVVLDHDPTAHAEVVAIRDACTRLGTHDLSRCVIFASCEPCPMCLGAIYWARVSRIVYAASRVEASAAGFDDSLFYDEIARPPEQRQVMIERHMRESAVEVLEFWREKPDKTPY